MADKERLLPLVSDHIIKTLLDEASVSKPKDLAEIVMVISKENPEIGKHILACSSISADPDQTFIAG